MGNKTISIIIPVKPGGVVKALDAVKLIDYPAEDLEIIIAEGKCPSRQRNRAAAVAGGEILYFLDDDSMVQPSILEKAVRHYHDPAVAAAGGPSLTPESDTSLQHVFGMALSSRFGSGSVSNRYRRSGGVRQTGDNELILCNLSMRSDVFLSLGGFDERLYPNEENELMTRMRQNGLVLMYDPSLAICRSQRRSFSAFVRQLFGYGRGRGRQTLLGGISNCASFAPPAFLLYLISVPLVAVPVYSLPLLCYLATALLCAVGGSWRAGKPRLALMLFGLFPVLHLSYGAGMLWELLTFPFRGNKGTGDYEVTVRKVKDFGSAPFG